MLEELLQDIVGGEGVRMAEDVPPVEDFGAGSVSCSEAASKNGGVAGIMFDTSMACTVQSACVMTTNGAENCNAVDVVYSNENPEVVEPKGTPSTWRSNQSSGSLDVTKNKCALNLVVSDSQTEDGKTVERSARRRYTKSVLEALRFVDVDKQQEKWDAIYKGLESIAPREYDEILASGQKKVNWNYDHQQRQEKKKEASTTKREYLAEDVPPVEDFGARSVSCSETASKNGGVAGIMFDTSIACTVQSAYVMTTNGAENCNAVDGVFSNESPEVVEPKGTPSTWRSNQSSGSLDVTKNECTLNLVVSDSQTEDGKTVERSARRRYTRSVLVALRFVDVDKQREKWDAIYKGLESIASREYDEILASGQKKVNWNYDHQQRQEKKKEASTTKREYLADNLGKASSAPEISSLLCSSSVDEESWAVEEEQCTEDDSDDEYVSIQRPAFYVEGEPDFESGPPQDGWEYLRRVRWEAAQMPKVKVAELDRTKWSSEQTPYMPKIPEIAKCPDNLSPLEDWVDIFLADFSELRKAFSEFENSTDRAICKPSDKDLCEDSSELKRNIPTVSAILDMDCVSRAATLRNRIKAFESASVLSRDNCLWLFALCAAVDTPLDAEMSSCLRCLLRKCSTLLAKKSGFDEEVAMLNILTVISGKYFGQSED